MDFLSRLYIELICDLAQTALLKILLLRAKELLFLTYIMSIDSILLFARKAKEKGNREML
jgi:hypothetical protein